MRAQLGNWVKKPIEQDMFEVDIWLINNDNSDNFSGNNTNSSNNNNNNNTSDNNGNNLPAFNYTGDDIDINNERPHKYYQYQYLAHNAN